MPFDKMGVEPVVLRATGNKFKSAVEPFLRQDMSSENQLQLSALLGSVWNDYLIQIASSRNLSAEKINLLADSMAVTEPQKAMENGLLDQLMYQDELQQLFIDKTGQNEFKDIAMISPSRYAELSGFGKPKYNDKRVAVIFAQGDIVMGDQGEYQIGSDRIAKAIRSARKNDRVKAIVLRVNSPGGNAMASDVIWREVQLASQEKPLIASMGNLAASGGYYISCVADTIMAQPNTITGSIGAFGLFFTGEELMNDKLGINIETVTTNKYADLGTFDRDISSAERKILIHQVDNIYRTFTERVAEGRGMTVAQVDSLGGGRVYSGSDALELGLVDMMGGLNEAITLAAEKANIAEDYTVMEYPKLKTPLWS
ncbi:MAG: signal peptide peptidase SppA [Owenweeksia sp.]|nr:signal peptide peptidase SppA [Owenweeksia sp.]